VTAAARPPRDGLSIGAVLTQLRPDFPDVTISKIRFLEAEGLISPARTESGYRQFTDVDVARLRFVLAAQRDHYLPLKVIRQQLAAADGAVHPAATARPLAAVPALPTADDFDEPADDVRLSRDEVVAEAGVDAALFAELEQYGLIRADQAGNYDADAVVVAATARAMTEFGIEPRHLRAFRASADREVGLLAQIVAPLDRHRDPAGLARAAQLRRELAALSVTLHIQLVKSGLRAPTGG
jgi:DNA-binding transcriptional MerR regulator